MNIFYRFRRKLSSKIALVFILSLLFIVVLPILTTSAIFGPKRFPAMTRIGIDHARYMIQTIGVPPNLDLARSLHQELGIQIRIENEQINWASNTDMIQFKDVVLAPIAEQPDTFAGFTDQGFCVEIHRGQTRFLFVLHPKKENIRAIGYTFLFILLFYTSVILSILYAIIKWLLRDVKVLAEGVKQIGAGHLKHRMFSKRHDELAQLINSFNAMSEKIQEMIHSREQLLLDVSHELRSPLTRLKLAIEFIEESAAKTSIQDDVRDVEIMISELLDGERLSSPHGGLKPAPNSVAVLIDDILKEFLQRKPGILVSNCPETLSLLLDRDRMKIVLRNLIDNALRYSDDEGKPVEIIVAGQTDEVIISIIDHGQGIPPTDLPHIFEPFYRVDKSRSKETGGYGLGLNLVQKIVMAHGGHIEVDSRISLGTSIHIHMPAR